jgi:hypothetical protein
MASSRAGAQEPHRALAVGGDRVLTSDHDVGEASIFAHIPQRLTYAPCPNLRRMCKRHAHVGLVSPWGKAGDAHNGAGAVGGHRHAERASCTPPENGAVVRALRRDGLDGWRRRRGQTRRQEAASSLLTCEERQSVAPCVALPAPSSQADPACEGSASVADLQLAQRQGSQQARDRSTAH